MKLQLVDNQAASCSEYVKALGASGFRRLLQARAPVTTGTKLELAGKRTAGRGMSESEVETEDDLQRATDALGSHDAEVRVVYVGERRRPVVRAEDVQEVEPELGRDLLG